MTMRSWICKLFTRPIQHTIRRAPRRVCLAVEALEDRCCPSAVTVANTNDVVNGTTTSIAALIASDGGDGISLREAVTAANNTAGADTINFSALFNSAQVITLGGTRLTLSRADFTDTTAALTITGPAAGLTISGNNASSVFLVDPGVTASFSGLTITGGNNSGIATANLSKLTLTNCTVSGNSSGTWGGGIYNRGGNVALTNCTISGNSAGVAGGGIFNGGGSFDDGGTVTLINCTVSGNAQTGGNNNYNFGGGGIYNRTGAVTLTNCTVSGNSSTARGGGIRSGGGILYERLRTHPADQHDRRRQHGHNRPQ